MIGYHTKGGRLKKHLSTDNSVSYYVQCNNCREDYYITAVPDTTHDWQEIQDRVGKPFGWCGKCCQFNDGC
jgi:hypothetical protein